MPTQLILWACCNLSKQGEKIHIIPAPKSQSEYDQLKLIQWQTCSNHFIEDARDF